MIKQIIKRLLRVRRNLQKKQVFMGRRGHWTKYHDGWHAPRGRHNKIRQNIRGKGKRVSIGYSAPKLVRGLHPSGLKDTLVHNMAELQKIDPTTQAARISGTVGEKKRTSLVTKANELKIQLLN